MRSLLKKINGSFVLPCLLCLLSGCMVGPDYHPPATCMPGGFIENREVASQEGINEDLAHWWSSFNDPLLDELLTESLKGNFDWKIALEQICAARANCHVQTAAVLPEILSDLQMTRSRTSQTVANARAVDNAFKIPPIQSFYQAGFDVVWQIDLFGGLRRASNAACDQWQASVENARGVRILILSEVAKVYSDICALQQLQEVALQAIALDEKLLQLNSSLFEAGLSNEQNRDMVVAQLESDRAALLVIEVNVRQAIYALAVLLGRPPECLLEKFLVARPIPTACGRIPVGLPSDLLRRRPDIRYAERQLAAATEEIGVAIANLFPKVSLTGSSASFAANPLQGANVGFASTSLSDWFTSASRIWGIGFVTSMPIFDFGKRMALVDQEVSYQHQALFAYEKTVIVALQEVESSLIAYFNEEERVAALTREAEINRRLLDLNMDLFQAGLASLNQVISTQHTWLNAISNQIASQQALTDNLILLYKALGGGWECSYTP